MTIVAVHCASFSEEPLQTELFGCNKANGSDEAKTGKILAAHGGTLFLNEIESLSLAIQVKLLRMMEDRKVSPPGANQSVHVDLRGGSGNSNA